MAGVAYASDLLTAGRALPPATSAGLSVADDVTHARSHFHTLTPLRSGCNAHFDRLRCGSSGKRFCADGPIPLAECVRACEETRGCGAVSLFRVGSALLADGTRHAYPGLHYFCRLLNSSCTASAEPGTCHATPRNWCSFALVPSRNCSASEQLRPTRLSSAASDSAVATQLAPQPEPTASARPRVYLGTSVVLGGGLNNMLMHVADLLRASCGRNATLVLPRLDGDPLASTYNASARYVQRHSLPPLAFGELFDAPHFIAAVRPCAVVEETPSLREKAGELPLTPLRAGWDRVGNVPALRRVYGALRPSPLVKRWVDRLAEAAARLAGRRWAAIHLPIERDWYWGTDFCQPRVEEGFTRRCYTPNSVAIETAASLRAGTATGVVLLYASDKVPPHGPPICTADFAPLAVAKLQVDADVAYTVRNAAEQFFAVGSPVAFYGNSYSSFSKGVATMRMGAGRGANFAYDCAGIEAAGWPPIRRRRRRGERRRRANHLTTVHPGFALLQTVRPERCRSIQKIIC